MPRGTAARTKLSSWWPRAPTSNAQIKYAACVLFLFAPSRFGAHGIASHIDVRIDSRAIFAVMALFCPGLASRARSVCDALPCFDCFLLPSACFSQRQLFRKSMPKIFVCSEIFNQTQHEAYYVTNFQFLIQNNLLICTRLSFGHTAVLLSILCISLANESYLMLAMAAELYERWIIQLTG